MRVLTLVFSPGNFVSASSMEAERTTKEAPNDVPPDVLAAGLKALADIRGRPAARAGCLPFAVCCVRAS